LDFFTIFKAILQVVFEVKYYMIKKIFHYQNSRLQSFVFILYDKMKKNSCPFEKTLYLCTRFRPENRVI